MILLFTAECFIVQILYICLRTRLCLFGLFPLLNITNNVIINIHVQFWGQTHIFMFIKCLPRTWSHGYQAITLRWTANVSWQLYQAYISSFHFPHILTNPFSFPKTNCSSPCTDAVCLSAPCYPLEFSCIYLHFQVSNEAEHVFMCLALICVSSLEWFIYPNFNWTVDSPLSNCESSYI